MSAEKTYAWEERTFPWAQAVRVRPDLRVPFAEAIGKRFGVNVSALLTTRGGGRFRPQFGHRFGTGEIALPGGSYPCSLLLVLHEVAHAVAWKKTGKADHSAVFKEELARVVSQVRHLRLLRGIVVAHEAERSRLLAGIRERRARAVAAEARRKAREDRRNSPEGRLERAREAVRRLETRLRRTETALGKARRRVRGLETAARRRTAAPATAATGDGFILRVDGLVRQGD